VAHEQAVNGRRTPPAQDLVEGLAADWVGMAEYRELRAAVPIEQALQRPGVELKREEERGSEFEVDILEADEGNRDQRRAQAVEVRALGRGGSHRERLLRTSWLADRHDAARRRLEAPVSHLVPLLCR